MSGIKGKSGRKVAAGSLRQRALAAGLPYAVVQQRIKVLGWPEERALREPVRKLVVKPMVAPEVVGDVETPENFINLPVSPP